MTANYFQGPIILICGVNHELSSYLFSGDIFEETQLMKILNIGLEKKVIWFVVWWRL